MLCGIPLVKFLMILCLQDALKGSKPLTKFGSFDDRNGREAGQVHSRSKSVLSALFMKQKAAKLKAGSVL